MFFLFHKECCLFQNPGNLPPLHLAASKGDLKTVKRILERKEFQIESLDDSQKTPLHHAALNGHKDIVNLLLQGLQVKPYFLRFTTLL